VNELEKEEINLLNKLYMAVISLDTDMASEAAKEASNLDPLKAIEKGLAKGVKEIGDKFSKGECFLPELIMAAEAMKAGLQVLEPRLRRHGEKRKTLGRFLIGTVAGDIHDIGKTRPRISKQG
jgi:methanogenic corrinoid protein MtbC1